MLRVTLEIACALALLVRSGADYRVAPDKAPVYGAWHTFEGTPSFLAPSASDRTEDENLVWHDAKWNTTGNYWKAVDGFAATTRFLQHGAEVSLKLHYGIQYVGAYLMRGSFAGDTIARATFEANFINDLSRSLENKENADNGMRK